MAWETGIAIIVCMGIWLFYKSSMELKGSEVKSKWQYFISLFLFLISFWLFTGGLGLATAMAEANSLSVGVIAMISGITTISIWVNLALTFYFALYFIGEMFGEQLKKFIK